MQVNCQIQRTFSKHVQFVLQKKDSHIKIIPAFKPVATMEPSTPDNTPEKSSQPQVRMDRSKVSVYVV